MNMVKMALNLMLPRQQFGLLSTLHATLSTTTSLLKIRNWDFKI